MTLRSWCEYYRGMGNLRQKRSQKVRRVIVRPGPGEELKWLRDDFLPAAGRLYAVLVHAGIVPAAQGRPKRRLWLSLQAVYWSEQKKLPMFRVGAMVEARGDTEASAKAIAAIEQLPVERQRVERERLKKLGRGYVEEGRAALSQQQGEGEWPPHLVSKGPVPPRDLRKHFQEMTIRAVARWLANEARVYCDTDTPAYDALVEVLDETSVMSRMTWFLQPN